MSIPVSRRIPAPFQPAYATFAEAERRVELLRNFGIWPGIRSCGIGYTLTFDLRLTLPEIKAKHW